MKALEDGSGDDSRRDTHTTGCHGLADEFGREEANGVSGRKADGYCVWRSMGPVGVSEKGGGAGVV